MEIAQSYTDPELISALKNDREMNAAIRFIYRNYYGLLENYIVNNNGSKDDAADIIQETIVAFIEIVEENRFRGESSVKSFLYSITRNLWLTELRRKNSADNRNKVFEKAKDTTEQEAVQHLIKKEYYNAIQALFEKLGDKCKQLLMLVYYEDLSMRDIVEKMPDYQNEQVLRNKKYKCMKQLEQMIQDNDQLKTQFKNALKNAG
ncbi:RNA polymerase sigma factor [Panacibacter sp. DH6]|uniref:RNA polymerase sigma factor n=1 Tax=Panacibacter microcysteis TaxID=2793269 RepID=A0A931E4V9_9BACT|nr:RNA polymerase sigma factor [Panacibacter microcysteis]MBG9375320.1 RNA polymerase sigma factor [Panacibacter microcysteis]